MNDTLFLDCSGLSDDAYSSAYDVALMSRELMKHKKITEYTTIWMDTLRDGQIPAGQYQQAGAALFRGDRAENRHHQQGGALPVGNSAAGWSGAGCGYFGLRNYRRAFRRCAQNARLWVCQLHHLHPRNRHLRADAGSGAARAGRNRYANSRSAECFPD